jgi:hypothetical protein
MATDALTDDTPSTAGRREVKPKVRRIDLYPDEFLAAVCGEMSTAELGVYWMICLLCYTRRGMIPDDVGWICGKFRPSKGNRTIRGAIERLVASGRVDRDGAEIGVRQCLDEVEIVLRRIRDASETGTKGNKIRWGRDRPPINPDIATINYQLPRITLPPAELLAQLELTRKKREQAK